MSSLARCFDAAFPPPVAPPGAAAVLGYIGNHRDDRDVHIWTPQEWQPFKDLRQFPVMELAPWLDAVISANVAVDQMLTLGWNYGRALVGAMETFEAPHWWARFEAQVLARGMVPVCYGSESTVRANLALHYWDAHYDGVPVIPPWAWAKQYQSLAAIDWSVVSPALMQHGGQGPRRFT